MARSVSHYLHELISRYSGVRKALRHEQLVQPKSERSIFTRRRFQVVGAVLVAAILPYALRYVEVPRFTIEGLLSSNALIGNLAAVIIAMWMRLSIETYPGIRSSYVIMPVTITAHILVVIFFLLTQLPYDRLGLTMGFGFHALWNYATYFLGERRTIQRIAIVPFGSADRLTAIDGVAWHMMDAPRLSATMGCHAIVADFSADLPDEWESFLADAALAGRIVFQVKQLSESLTGRVELAHLSENSFGSLLPARGYFHLKTLVDFIAAVAVLPLALPLMAGAALAILIEGRGPVLFQQRRLGHAGILFTAYKFRTMIPLSKGEEADLAATSFLTDEQDPRITPLGRFLRKHRIDELPQIFNILKLEMSWIGPRPEAEILTRWFTAEVPFYRYRHVVKPGISGWAQVNQGYSGNFDDENVKLQYDFYYIKYFSPWLDVLIVFRTIKTILTGFGSR